VVFKRVFLISKMSMYFGVWPIIYSNYLHFLLSAPSMHHSNSNPMMSEEATRGVAVEKFDSVKKWSINTYKVENTPHGNSSLTFYMSLMLTKAAF